MGRVVRSLKGEKSPGIDIFQAELLKQDVNKTSKALLFCATESGKAKKWTQALVIPLPE